VLGRGSPVCGIGWKVTAPSIGGTLIVRAGPSLRSPAAVNRSCKQEERYRCTRWCACPDSLLPCPFAPSRALKGDQAPNPTGTPKPIRASLLVEGCVLRPPLRPGRIPAGTVGVIRDYSLMEGCVSRPPR